MHHATSLHNLPPTIVIGVTRWLVNGSGENSLWLNYHLYQLLRMITMIKVFSTEELNNYYLYLFNKDYGLIVEYISIWSNAN